CYTGTYWGSQPYAFGASQPDVPSNKALYYWTAYLQSISSDTGFQGMSSSSLYRIYIFVFAKGDPNNVYTAQALGGVYQSTTNPTGYTPTPPAGMVIFPQLASGAFNSIKASNGATSMPIGSLGLDVTIGTVVREIIGATGTITSVPSTTATNNDTVLYAPAATGNGSVSSTQTDSPLIYIYTGTVSF
ncbi:MAG TPA: hypothetical protein VKJ65_10960, partial [Phycisphaerae bacterium]|nr:hypothetical protein [Phycisphaerae bacterium]